MPRDSHRNHISTDTPPPPQPTYTWGWVEGMENRKKKEKFFDGDFLKEKYGGEKGIVKEVLDKGRGENGRRL
jgi:hypothetical protein